jgi:hypothetical protein
MAHVVNCPHCLERAEGFVVPMALAKEFVHASKKDRADRLILARGTKAELARDWRQKRHGKRRPVIWKPEHDIIVTSFDAWHNHESVHHAAFRNRDRGQAHPVALCEAPELFTLIGPGAEAHIAADAEVIAARDAKEHYEAFDTARKEGTSRELDGYCKQLRAAFAALGFDVTAGGSLFSRTGDTSYINLKPDDAATIIEALGGTVARRAVDPMPVWSVRYAAEPDEDKDPLLLGARNEAAVVAHMMKNYCDERREEGPNVPLKREKIHIQRIDEPPKPPEEKSDAA